MWEIKSRMKLNTVINEIKWAVLVASTKTIYLSSTCKYILRTNWTIYLVYADITSFTYYPYSIFQIDQKKLRSIHNINNIFKCIESLTVVSLQEKLEKDLKDSWYWNLYVVNMAQNTL